MYRPNVGWTRPTHAIVTLLLAACLRDTSGPDFSCITGCGIPPQPSVTVVGPTQRAGWDTVVIGSTIQLTATLRDGKGAVLTGRTFQWTSDDATKATVAESGRLTALGAGRVQITATAMPDGIVGGITIDILPGPVVSISVTPAAASIRLGESRTLTAKGFDAYGTELPLATVEWSSSNAAVATVSANGIVSALVVGGPITITATALGKSSGALVTVTPSVAVTFTTLALGANHTCGLTTQGAVYCWGSNAYGQLGDGTIVDRPNAAPVVQGIVVFNQLTAGDYHTCANTPSGFAYCWGRNDTGQLGDRSTTQRVLPTPVHQTTTYATLFAGLAHTCGLTSAGDAYCWGFNEYGQVGIASTVTPQTAAVHVAQGAVVFRSLTLKRMTSCGLTTAGNALCWGYNGSGQLGDGTKTARSVPTPVTQGSETFTGLALGAYHACGLTARGNAVCWGELVFPNPPAIPFPSVTPAQDQSLVMLASPGGYSYQCGVITGGRPICWGWNALGQLGDGNLETKTDRLALVDLSEPVFGVASADTHACAWTVTGKAFCWGRNEHGQLGDGTRVDQSRPVLVRVP